MDILNLWNDDPEELLLDLGFGCDEPDLSGRIPARFINYQSQARGINLHVFLEAQKNRLDLENPDVSNRFKQLEVLQQVTTAFSSLVGSSCSALGAPHGKQLPPEAQERRRRMGVLFRRASKKSLSQIHKNKTQEVTTPSATSPPCALPESPQLPPCHRDKSVRSGLHDMSCLSPLAEEQGNGPDPQAQPSTASLMAQEGAPGPWPIREGYPLTKSPLQVRESFEMEEIHSFDDSSIAGSYMGRAVNNLVQGIIRTNSCQSDSSGFLEELFIPSLSQEAPPGSNLITPPPVLSGDINGSESRERLNSPTFHTSLQLSSSLTAPGVEESVLSSPSHSPEHSLVVDPYPSPVSLRLSKSDLQISETEKPPDHEQSQPTSLPATLSIPINEYVPEFQNPTDYQSATLPVPASFTFNSPTFSLMQPPSLIRDSENINTEEKDAPSSNLCTASHDSDATACSSGRPLPASSPSPSSNLDLPFTGLNSMSSEKSNFSPGSSGITPSKRTDVALHENSLSACGDSSFLLSSSIHCTDPDFHSSSTLMSPSLIDPLSRRPDNDQEDSPSPSSGGVDLSDPSTTTHMEREESPYAPFIQKDKDNPLAPPSHVLVSPELEKRSATLPCLSFKPSTPICQSALSSQLQNPGDLINPAVERISDGPDQSITQNSTSCSHNNKTPTDSSPGSSAKDVIHVEMNDLSLDSEGTLQMSGTRLVEVERHTDTTQSQEAAVFKLDTESSADLSESSRWVCNQTEQEPPLSTDNKSKDLRKICTVGTEGKESESLTRYEDVLEAHSRTKVEPKHLIEIESLDLVFQTSVDGSEGENEDMDVFFHQLDTEGRVFWAEPVQLFSTSPVLEESGSLETSDENPGNPLWLIGPAAQDSFSSTGPVMSKSLSSLPTMDTDQTPSNGNFISDTPSSFTVTSLPTNFSIPEGKPASCSVSVQMSASPSSHIVHRKDIPYMTESNHTPLPSVLPLDTSTPFRAVQSWTDLQIQRNALTKLLHLPHGDEHIATKKLAVSMAASETTPTLIFTSSSSFPLERDRCAHEDEEKLWEGNQVDSMACHCACDHQCTCCTQKIYNKEHTLGNAAYSLDELEEMMLCLQQFFAVLSNMEEQLSEDQAAVYSVLSDKDREKIQDIQELRQAVKEEAGELEMQLNELAHHYDDSLKMKMHRLLDEQSLLCSQLRVFLPGMMSRSLSPTHRRTVATQCCLLPWIPPANMQNGDVPSWITLNVDPPRLSPPGSESFCEGMGCSPTKADKLDIVGLLQRLKESLRPSVNTDSVE